MDMHNEHRMACSEIQTQIGARKMVAGAKQLRKAINAGSVFCVYLAANADPAITEPLEDLCKRSKVKYAWASSMKELGNVCGIEVGASAAAAINN